MSVAEFTAVLQRLESVADRLEKGAGAAPAAKGAAAAGGDGDSPIALSWDNFAGPKVAAVVAAAKECTADVTDATEMFTTSLSMLRQILAASGKCSKPKDGDWPKILGKIMELGGKAQQACDNRSDFFQNRKAVAEALNVVTLVTSPSPPSHIQNVLETMDFHAIKVMQKKDPPQTAWIKALKELVKDMKDWCNDECKLGLIWKPQGADPVEYFTAQPLGSAAPAGGAKGGGKGKGAAPPPPKGGFSGPPPEVLEKMKANASAAPAAGGGMAAVFSDIGNFSTSKLKKVTDDMKTKNQPKDERSAVVPAAKAAGARTSVTAKAGKGPKGPPIKELQKELNWMIENFEGTHDLVLDEPDVQKQHLVCMINCKNATLQVKTKVKSINIDGCEKVNVIFGDVISSVELVNSDRCQVQTTGKVNSFAIDKCNGVNVFLSKESLGAEIVSSKSSEMNLTIPDPAGGEGDIIEMPIPEQFVTKLVGPKKLHTEVSSLYS